MTNLPVQVEFHGLDRSEAVEKQITEKVLRLQRFHSRIVKCRVVIDCPHRHHRTGRVYNVRIDLSIPGADVIVRRQPSLERAHEDLFVALRDAFDIARRKLEDQVRENRPPFKTRSRSDSGRVARLFPERGYGFLEASDGHEVYFERNSVLDDAFDRLDVGTVVRFAEEPGDKGPQASTVEVAESPKVQQTRPA